MKASEIKRRKRGLDKRYGRICPVCGKPIRKPRRGPTARFCGTACRQAYGRRKRALAERKKDESAEQTVSQLVRQEEDAPSDGYVAGLMDDIDRQGRPGDAERLLRHNGYTGPIPR